MCTFVHSHRQGDIKCDPLGIYRSYSAYVHAHWRLSVSLCLYMEAWEGPACGICVNMSVHT